MSNGEGVAKRPRLDYWESGTPNKLELLISESLFKNCLLPDIKSGVVFPAIRGRKIDFYLKGRKLCSFNGKAFQANVAYLAAFQNRPKGEITESVFAGLKICTSFEDGYEQIKKNVALNKQPESGGVSELCNKLSCYREEINGAIGVLDIELSLLDEDYGNQDRLDLILFNQKSQQLRFFEVKTFDNKEIWSRNGKVAVCNQIAKYKRQLERRKEKILEWYKQYVLLMNTLCCTELPEPNSFDTEPDLLLIGFGREQINKIKNEIIPSFGNAFKCCLIGDPTKASSKTLAKWWKNRRE